MAEEIIMRMARAYFTHAAIDLGVEVPEAEVAWDGLKQTQRDIAYDAMWHALHELREPTTGMAGAALAGDPDWRMKMSPTAKAFTAMINNLLEVK